MKKIFNFKKLFVSLFMIMLFPSYVNAKELNISGTDLTDGGSVNSITGDGSATYDTSTNILTLDNYNGTYITISEMPNNLTIKLIGTSTLNGSKKYRFYPEKTNRNRYYDYLVTLYHNIDLNIIGDNKNNSKLVFTHDTMNTSGRLYSINSLNLESDNYDKYESGTHNLSIKNATIESGNVYGTVVGTYELNIEDSDLLLHQHSDDGDAIDVNNGNITNSNIKLDDSNCGIVFRGKLQSKNSNYDLYTYSLGLSFNSGSIIDGGEFNIKSSYFAGISMNAYTEIINITNAKFNINYDMSPTSDYVFLDNSSGIIIYYDAYKSPNIGVNFINNEININGYKNGITVSSEGTYCEDDYDLSKEEIEEIEYYPLNLVFKDSKVNIENIRQIGISIRNTDLLVENSIFNVSSNLAAIVEGLENTSNSSDIYVGDVNDEKRNEYFKQANITFKNSEVKLESFHPYDNTYDTKIYNYYISHNYTDDEAKYNVISFHYSGLKDINLNTYIEEINKLNLPQEDKDNYIFCAKFYENLISKKEFLDYYINIYEYSEEEALEEYEYYLPFLSSKHSLGTIILAEANINFESGDIDIKSNGKAGILAVDADINFDGADVNVKDSDTGIYIFNNGNRPATINFNDGIFEASSEEASIYINDISNNSEINFDKHMGLRNFEQAINMEEKDGKKIITVINNEEDKQLEKEIEVTKKYYFVDMEDINKEIKNYDYDLNNKEDFIVRIDGALDRFDSVEIDGQVIDESEYKLSEGSTIIDFLKTLLEKFELGNHTITVHYKDYGIARANFNLTNTDPDLDNPDTGDFITDWIILFVISIGGLIYCFKKFNWLRY